MGGDSNRRLKPPLLFQVANVGAASAAGFGAGRSTGGPCCLEKWTCHGVPCILTLAAYDDVEDKAIVRRGDMDAGEREERFVLACFEDGGGQGFDWRAAGERM